MDHLPVEVLHEIFIKLHLIDKLKCMLVCRFWRDTLDKRSLLHTVYIQTSDYPKFRAMLDRHSYRAAQVEYLALSPNLKLEIDKRVFCNLFPNLKVFELTGWWCEHFATAIDMGMPFHFMNSSSKLRRIKDNGECEMARQLGISNMCQNLKSLDLKFTPVVASVSSHIIAQLKNMPVLETLTLLEFKVKLMDLEILHHNLTSIKTLHLDRLSIIAGEIPQDVVPASLVTGLKLTLTSADDRNSHIQFYKYIYNKYTSITKFAEFSDDVVPKKALNYIKAVYNQAILPLFERVGPQTDDFFICHYWEGLDAFRKFDGFRMKLKRLRIGSKHNHNMQLLEEIAQSQQSKYIQEVEFFNFIPEPINRLSSMTALEFFYLDFRASYDRVNFRNAREIDFNQLINACPATLKSLIITHMDLTFNEPVTQKSSVQELVLSHTALTEDLANTITTCFPKLTKLELEGQVTAEDLTISLPNNHLKELTLKMDHEKGDETGFSITTEYNGKPITHAFWPVYTERLGGRLNMNGEAIELPPDDECPHILSVSCASIGTFVYSFKELHDNNRW